MEQDCHAVVFSLDPLPFPPPSFPCLLPPSPPLSRGCGENSMRGNEKEAHLFLTGAAVLLHCPPLSFLPSHLFRTPLLFSLLILSVFSSVCLFSDLICFCLIISLSALLGVSSSFCWLRYIIFLHLIFFSSSCSFELPSRSLAENSYTFGFVRACEHPCRTLFARVCFHL